MSGIRRSKRIETVTGTCGHDVWATIPAGNLGPVGRKNIAEARARACYDCSLITVKLDAWQVSAVEQSLRAAIERGEINDYSGAKLLSLFTEA